jgi:hypothetical protein
MIYVYGDSHASVSFRKLQIPYRDCHQNSITMFRIGRDNLIINFNNNDHNDDSIICIAYGEIDCRCHIQRQIDLGANEDCVINELVHNYFRTIVNSIKAHKKIVVVGVIPQTSRADYENVHGPILHEFPFVGKDEDRVRYTTKMNVLIEAHCNINEYVYFNPYDYYTRDNGTLKYDLSDNCVHLGDNSFFLEKFMDVYKKIIGDEGV